LKKLPVHVSYSEVLNFSRTTLAPSFHWHRRDATRAAATSQSIGAGCSGSGNISNLCPWAYGPKSRRISVVFLVASGSLLQWFETNLACHKKLSVVP
jgi:hypothetical protein